MLFSLQIIWGALLMSVGIYVGVAFFVFAKGGGAVDPTLPIGTLELVFALLSLGFLGAAYVVPRLLLRKALATEDAATMDLGKLVRIAQTPLVVRLALCEVVAIFGLLLVMLSQQPMRIVPFAGLAALAILAAFPSESALRDAKTP